MTIDPRGRPRPVPICFVVTDSARTPLALYTPIDEKTKETSDPLRLARVRDVVARPAAAVLVDSWDEDWDRLWWIRVTGVATVVAADEPSATEERARAIEALRAKYPQYATHALEDRPIIRVVAERITSWGLDRS